MSGARDYLQALMDAPLLHRCRTLKRGGRTVQDHAHFASPGTGPAGEACGTCAHLVRNAQFSKLYFKCGLVTQTKGAATDIAKRDAACIGWERRPC